jgi:predicted small metal-binding protein
MVLRCDCGFRASGEREAELVAAAQNHARDVHGTDVDAEVVAGLLRSRPATRSADADGGAP